MVIEAGQLNRQASGRNAGSLHFQLEHRLLEDGEDQTELFARILPLTLIAIDDWRRLEEELRGPLGIHMRGGLMVAESSADVARLERKHDIEASWKLPVRLMTAKEVASEAPYLADSVRLAGYCPLEGHANPRQLTLAYASRAESLGVTFVVQREVSALYRADNQWHAETRPPRTAETLPTIVADTVLNAAGAWATRISALAGMNHPVTPMPLMMNVTDRCAPFIPHLVQHVSRKLSLKQVSDGNVLIGGGWPSRWSSDQADGLADFARPQLVPENVGANLQTAVSVVPALARRLLLRCWTGIASVTQDQLPLLGQSRQARRYFVATSGSAFTLGPTFARLVSELIAHDEASTDIGLFDPDRFGSPATAPMTSG